MPQDERTYHEVLVNAQPNKMVVDIDVKLSELSQATEELMKGIFYWTLAIFYAAGEMADDPPDFDLEPEDLAKRYRVIVTTSNREGKFSYHLIFPTIVCQREGLDHMYPRDYGLGTLSV